MIWTKSFHWKELHRQVARFQVTTSWFSSQDLLKALATVSFKVDACAVTKRLHKCDQHVRWRLCFNGLSPHMQTNSIHFWISCYGQLSQRWGHVCHRQNTAFQEVNFTPNVRHSGKNVMRWSSDTPSKTKQWIQKQIEHHQMVLWDNVRPSVWQLKVNPEIYLSKE